RRQAGCADSVHGQVQRHRNAVSRGRWLFAAVRRLRLHHRVSDFPQLHRCAGSADLWRYFRGYEGDHCPFGAWALTLVFWSGLGFLAFRLCGRACGVAVGFFLEKQLASLRHLFPAKNPTATPRRRALAGFRLVGAAVRFALRAGSDQFDATFNGASGYSRCFLLFAFCFLLFAFCFLYSAFPCCTSVGGCGVFFWQGKRCLSEASCFSQKKNTPHPAYPPPQQEGWEPKPAAQKPKQDRSAKQEYK